MQYGNVKIDNIMVYNAEMVYNRMPPTLLELFKSGAYRYVDRVASLYRNYDAIHVSVLALNKYCTHSLKFYREMGIYHSY